MSSFWRISRRNLARNRRRNLATGAAIALGFAALLVVGGYYDWTGNMLRVFTIYSSHIGHIVVVKHGGLEKRFIKPRQFSLDEADLAAIAAVVPGIPDLDLHGPQLVGTGLAGNGCRSFPFVALGIPPSLEQSLRDHPETERWIGDLRNYKKGRIISSFPADIGPIAIAGGLARYLGKTKVYDELTPDQQKNVTFVDCNSPSVSEQIDRDTNVQLAAGSWSGMMSSVDAEIVAVQSTGLVETDNTGMIVPLALLQRLYGTPNATAYGIWLKNPRKIDETMQILDEKFKSMGRSFDIYRWDDPKVSPYYSGTKQFLFILVMFVSCVSLCVVLFSIFNSATITILERSQEIGMMRSLGFSQVDVRKLYVMEMLQLAIFSVFIGGSVAIGGIELIKYLHVPYTAPGISVKLWLQLTPNVWMVIGAALTVFILTLLITLLAVWSVSGRNIADLVSSTRR